MRKLLDKALWRLGYMRRTLAISGDIEFTLGEQPFVNLTIPGGQRVYGWVNNQLTAPIVNPPNPILHASPDCTTCGHERDAHGVGPIGTACYAIDKIPTPTGDSDQICDCPAYENGQ